MKIGASYSFLPTATYSLLFHQEERATAQYMEALQFQGSEQWDKAEDIYQNLLESDVLSKVEIKVKVKYLRPLIRSLVKKIYNMYLSNVRPVDTL